MLLQDLPPDILNLANGTIVDQAVTTLHEVLSTPMQLKPASVFGTSQRGDPI